MSRFPAEILDLRQFRDKKNSQEIRCSFAVIGCSLGEQDRLWRLNARWRQYREGELIVNLINAIIA
jgi:hypothetical protein